MAASFINRIFNYNSSSRHDNDTHFAREDLGTPPPSPATSQTHTPYLRSRSSSPSRVDHTTIPTSMASPEQLRFSSAVPIDHELLSESEVPRCQASSIEPNSKSGKSRQKSELSTIPKARDYNLILPQTVYQPTRRFSPALVLQNTGSVARDHLASERTFLAYVRTSLGLASAGVALVQLFTIADLTSKSTGVPLPVVNQRVQKFATPLGLSALGMALIVLFIGVFRYFLVQHALPENRFPTARLTIAFISFGLGAITATAFGALLSGKLHHD